MSSHDTPVPRVLLLLPTATYRAPDFLAAARALGVEVVVGSEQPQAMADSMGDRSVVVPLDDPEAAADAVAALHARSPVDAVVAVDDQGVLIAAVAADRLGLPHNPPDAVAATRDKAAMRRALAAAGVPQPASRSIDGEPTASVGFPCVVKPVSLSASRGVIRADDPAAATAAAARVRGDAWTGRCSSRSSCPASRSRVEGLLRAGRLEVLAVFDKPDPLDGPYFEETIYVTPSRLAARRAGRDRARRRACRRRARARGGAGPRRGCGSRRGRVVVLEVAARSIGGLCSRTLRFGAGHRARGGRAAPRARAPARRPASRGRRRRA